jgi:hypothetical protein
VEEPKMELQDAMPHINKAFDEELAMWGLPIVAPKEEEFWREKK